MSFFVGRVVLLSGVSGASFQFSDLWSVCCPLFQRV